MEARGQGWVEQGVAAKSVAVSTEPIQAANNVAVYPKEHPDTDVLFLTNTEGRGIPSE